MLYLVRNFIYCRPLSLCGRSVGMVHSMRWTTAALSHRVHISKYFSDHCIERKHQPYFITTPIFYVNSVPHIGHLHSTVLADTMSRWKRLKQQQVIFSTGTDEHGLKVQQSAELVKKSPKAHCDGNSKEFKNLFKQADVENTDFIRTSEERHRKVVHHFWNLLASRGYIETGSYDGWYSLSDEAFVPQELVSTVTGPEGSQVKVSTETGRPVTWISEQNYMFPLLRLKDDLLYWLRGNVIHPAHFEPQVTRFVEEKLQDLSISRTRERLEWGIPVPGDSSQTIYVWLDALVNYLTVGGFPEPGYLWPADCHIVGKDILKFHAVYWPAFLIAAGLEPPRNILCHSHWLVNGVKMSKSLGNVVDPVVAMEKYTSDGLRYFLMRESVLHSDSNFLADRVVDLLNSELANTFGNLLGRCTSNALNKDGVFPVFNEAEFMSRASEEDKNMWDDLHRLPELVGTHYENFEMNKAIEAVMSQLRNTNRFVDYHKPWELAKIETEKPWLNTIIHGTMETLRVSATMLSPVVPRLATTLLDRLRIPPSFRTFDGCESRFDGGTTLDLKSTKLVFPRLK